MRVNFWREAGMPSDASCAARVGGQLVELALIEAKSAAVAFCRTVSTERVYS